MRDYKVEFEQRVAYIRDLVESSHSKGIVFGNSGGKDSALVGILCKAACDNTVGIIMPCASKRNFGLDKDDGNAVAEQFHIETRVIDLTEVRQKELDQLATITEMNRDDGPCHRQHRSPTAHDDAVRRGRRGRTHGGRHRQCQRSVYGILHQMGRRRP